MGTETQVQDMARENLRASVKETIQHLENGAGNVEGCPGHQWIAKGLILCLRMLLTQINATQASAQKHLAASSVGGFLAVLAAEVIRRTLEK